MLCAQWSRKMLLGPVNAVSGPLLSRKVVATFCFYSNRPQVCSLTQIWVLSWNKSQFSGNSFWVNTYRDGFAGICYLNSALQNPTVPYCLLLTSLHSDLSGGNYNLTVTKAGEDSQRKVTLGGLYSVQIQTLKKATHNHHHTDHNPWTVPCCAHCGKETHTKYTWEIPTIWLSTGFFPRAYVTGFFYSLKYFTALQSVRHVSHVLQHLTKLPVIPSVSELASLLMYLRRFLAHPPCLYVWTAQKVNWEARSARKKNDAHKTPAPRWPEPLFCAACGEGCVMKCSGKSLQTDLLRFIGCLWLPFWSRKIKRTS